ncbi:hypothetical protein BDQ94DRAFT_164150 [Aspergillus welwitschiae]|uniref:Uncharacterized protein n=1 Tax=Aspergillus welwitschiae TaxID=1341132 RepID=A0A3F3PIR8_9EURO|nr:hypothetical protein BDQ94DRAFT_164150 [Aspergillus welwitschiae]RDH26831.1 hypothetical protein BDQ94DRAFT_164150 [Aspergillus welwitschiae]
MALCRGVKNQTRHSGLLYGWIMPKRKGQCSVLRWETGECLHAIWPTRTSSHGKQRLTVGNILAGAVCSRRNISVTESLSVGEQRKLSLCFALVVTAILRARQLCS